MQSILEREFKCQLREDCVIDYKELAFNILYFLEANGMKPPTLPEEYCQAIMSIYYGGYSFNQWEEEFYKDEKVVEALTRREEAAERRKQKSIERKKAKDEQK